MFYFQKGLSRPAARTVGRALALAGQQGCPQADTGHLLLAMLQTAQGPAADFLRRKQVTETALCACTAQRAGGRPAAADPAGPGPRKPQSAGVCGAWRPRGAPVLRRQ